MFDIVSINYGIFVVLTARFTRRLSIDCSIIRVLRMATELWITAEFWIANRLLAVIKLLTISGPSIVHLSASGKRLRSFSYLNKRWIISDE